MKIPQSIRPLSAALEVFVRKRKALFRLEESLGKKLQPIFDKHRRSESLEAENECHSIAVYLREIGHFGGRFFFQRVFEIQERRKKRKKRKRHAKLPKAHRS